MAIIIAQETGCSYDAVNEISGLDKEMTTPLAIYTTRATEKARCPGSEDYSESTIMDYDLHDNEDSYQNALNRGCSPCDVFLAASAICRNVAENAFLDAKCRTMTAIRGIAADHVYECYEESFRSALYNRAKQPDAKKASFLLSAILCMAVMPLPAIKTAVLRCGDIDLIFLTNRKQVFVAIAQPSMTQMSRAIFDSRGKPEDFCLVARPNKVALFRFINGDLPAYDMLTASPEYFLCVNPTSISRVGTVSENAVNIYSEGADNREVGLAILGMKDKLSGSCGLNEDQRKTLIEALHIGKN